MLLATVPLAVGCSDDEGVSVVDAGMDAAPDSGAPDLSTEASLTELVTNDGYADWDCEPAPRDAGFASPHGRARVCFNDVLAASVAAASVTHPEGSVAVKEIYSETDELQGHAVAVKTVATATSNVWVWYEGFATNNYSDNIYGEDISVCVTCHSGAERDRIFTTLQ